MDSFIVNFWVKIFSLLRYISIFKLVTLLNKKIDMYLFVEIYVIFNTLFAFASIFVVKYFQNSILIYIILLYSFIRVFEIVVYQINVLLFDEYVARLNKKSYSIKSYRRMIILLIHNFVEIIFWFAFTYSALSFYFTNNVNNYSVGELIYQSFAIMTTFGTTKIEPVSHIGLYIMWFQSFSGLLMTILSITRFIGSLRPVDAEDNN